MSDDPPRAPTAGDERGSATDDDPVSTGGDDRASTAGDGPGYDVANPEEKEFGWRGWLLVAVLVLTLVVVPWAIVGLPAAQGFLGSLGLGMRDAYLALPMVPALLLGAVGVWTALANRRS